MNEIIKLNQKEIAAISGGRLIPRCCLTVTGLTICVLIGTTMGIGIGYTYTFIGNKLNKIMIMLFNH